MKAKLVKESLNEYYKYNEPKALKIYKRLFKPRLKEIAEIIYDKITNREWKIYEILSSPNAKFKFGSYRSREPWNYFSELYKELAPEEEISLDQNMNITDILVDELENAGLLRLEW